mgnify:CR=1 FL=1
MNRIDPGILSSDTVELRPMDESHFAELESIAKDKSIWQYYTLDGSNHERFRKALESAMFEKKKGIQFPFVIFHKKHRRLVGSTRFLDIQLNNKKLEIGWTWLQPEFWATSVNPECKLLLLTYCFENLRLYRVQFKTDENNLRSRSAIEKVGGKFEGILRNDMLRDDGTKRNSAYYSIIEEEWPIAKMNLKKQLIDIASH